ncbi:MAG: hypothetical protein ACREUM_05915, partial [Nitrosospira sp.]
MTDYRTPGSPLDSGSGKSAAKASAGSYFANRQNVSSPATSLGFFKSAGLPAISRLSERGISRIIDFPFTSHPLSVRNLTWQAYLQSRNAVIQDGCVVSYGNSAAELGSVRSTTVLADLSHF